ncbi:MAG TPA: SDR family oxidoreductase [Trebonia sp.]|nr:SDR family oxidoreductase [Trebonia sp.]
MAHALARRGARLALVDRDAARLDRVAEAVRQQHGVTVTTYLTDLADDAATHDLGRRLAAAHPDATLLVNNAGVALGGTFEQVSEEDFDWLMAINFRAVVTLTRTLLPVLAGNRGSHLVNMSSLFGLIAPAGQVAYATSKFAVRGFTEALRAELAGRVGVTVVHPGGIATRIAESARVAAGASAAEEAAGKASFARLLTYPPEKAAAEIADAIERRRPRLLIATSARVPDLIARITPGRYPAVLATFERRMARRAPG